MKELHKTASKLELISKHRGVTGIIDYLKDMRLSLLLFLSGEYPKKKVVGVKVDHDGFPIFLKGFKYLFESSTPSNQLFAGLRGLLTLLFCTRALSKGKIVDTDSITTPPLRDDIECYYANIPLFWKELGLRHSFTKTPRVLQFRKYHLSVKSGPNGPAMMSAINDLFLIQSDLKLLESLKTIGGPLMTEHLDQLIRKVGLLRRLTPQYIEKSLRKLS